MPDTLGNISVPEVAASGTFPLPAAYPLIEEVPLNIVTHAFRNESANLKIEQRFLLGTGARRWQVNLPMLTLDQRDTLLAFWESRKGSYQPFTWNKPTDDKTTTEAVTVRFENEPLVFQAGGQTMAAQVALVEVPTSAPTYTVSSTDSRFPSGTLQTALLAQVQQMIPLVKITVRQSGYPVIYISDRRCTVGGQLYLARLIRWDGITQTMNGESDTARFTCGNADRVMTSLVNDVANGADLWRATIEFSLYHVGSQIKLDLWKGYVTEWAMDEGPEFEIQASDGLYDLNLMYPPDVIDRQCWKQRQGLFNDGVTCPFASQGSLDTGHFPSASGASCDGGYETDNGCLAHGMKRYYGGIIAEPQGVRILDNSTGTWGYSRSPITSTSIIADSVYGQVLPRVFTDVRIPVPCKVVAGRDESDFYDALAIVSKGPIGAFSTGHELDGSKHHGYPGALGLREALGTDPAGATDFFSLGQSGNQTGSDWRKTFSGNSTYKDNFAAGVAFIEIRRGDEKGLQLTRPSDHSAVAYVSEGLSGWIWTAPTFLAVGVLVNPVWVALDALLEVMRIKTASAATMEQFFVVADAVAAAAVCSTTVNKIIGAGNEPQFKFRGFIQEQKPLRAWLQEILNTCLGYYTFDFGKLSFGIRTNASVVEAFTIGNVIDGSTKLQRLHPDFNELTAQFGDSEFEYQPNSVSVAVPDHVIFYGQRQPSQINLVGVDTKSQAGRVATVRLREEIGGITAAEWKAARTISIGTTVLALNVKPGMVCSLTHPDMPGGMGKFRVVRIVWNGDFSVIIEGRTVTDSMYDLVTGPKPVDVAASPVPIERVPYPLRPAWGPVVATPPSGDQFYSQSQLTFRLFESYGTLADGTVGSYVQMRGSNGVNSFLDVPIPRIVGISYATSGGSLTSGRDYFVQVVPYVGNGSGAAEELKFGLPSNVLAIHIPSGSGSSCSISLPDVTWPQPPAGESWGGYAILAGRTERTICVVMNVPGASLPSSVTITTASLTGNSSIQPNLDRIEGRAKVIISNGIVHGDVTAITSTTIVVAAFAGGGDAFSGRRLSVLSGDRSDREVDILNFACTGYDQSTGTFTVTQNPVSLGVKLGARLIVRATPSVSGRNISDAAWDLPADLGGYICRIIAGTGAGQTRAIGANTSTQITVDEDWTTAPDSTSVVLIEEPDWAWSSGSSSVPYARLRTIQVEIPVDNMRGVFLLVGGFAVDRLGNYSRDDETPMREIYFRGEPFEILVDSADYTATSDDRVILIDTTAAARDVELASADLTKGQTVTLKKIAGANAATISGPVTATVEDSAVYYSDGVDYHLIGGSAGAGSGGASVSAYMLTSPATVNDGPGSSGALLVVEITQDATGGHEVTWGANFAGSPDIRMGANEVTRLMFVTMVGQWHLISGGY